MTPDGLYRCQNSSYEERGSGGRPILFSHGLLMDRRQYERQIERLSDGRRCVAYDHRGQGDSEVPDSPAIDMETVYVDAARLIERLDLAPCHVVGTSMGGFVALRLAARRPELVSSIALLSTRAGPEPEENLPKYEMLTSIARWLGPRWLAGRLMPIFFGETFLNDPDREEVRREQRRRLADRSRQVYRAVDGVLYRPSVEGEIDAVDVPALVVHGREDEAIPFEVGRRLAEALPDARFEGLPDGGHTLAVERPDAVNRMLADFFEEVEGG
ncbi:MAG: alpha/beta fold hydrolase [Bradymonadaceae bacterium]